MKTAVTIKPKETKVVNGVFSWRINENHPWQPFTPQQLTKLLVTEKSKTNVLEKLRDNLQVSILAETAIFASLETQALFYDLTFPKN